MASCPVCQSRIPLLRTFLAHSYNCPDCGAESTVWPLCVPLFPVFMFLFLLQKKMSEALMLFVVALMAASFFVVWLVPKRETQRTREERKKRLAAPSGSNWPMWVLGGGVMLIGLFVLWTHVRYP
jgi:hypothetical protein